MALDQLPWGLLWPFLGASRDAAYRGTAETRAAVLGPWAFNTGAANSLGCDFIRAK